MDLGQGKELDDVPLSYVVASADWCAVATADEKIALFRTSDGKPREPLPVGGKPVAPALCGDVLVIAGESRIAALFLAESLVLALGAAVTGYAAGVGIAYWIGRQSFCACVPKSGCGRAARARSGAARCRARRS